jgi:hypothetical protein
VAVVDTMMNLLALFVKDESMGGAGSVRGRALLHGVRRNLRVEFSVACISSCQE